MGINNGYKQINPLIGEQGKDKEVKAIHGILSTSSIRKTDRGIEGGARGDDMAREQMKMIEQMIERKTKRRENEYKTDKEGGSERPEGRVIKMTEIERACT